MQGHFNIAIIPIPENAELIPAYLFEKGKLKEHQKALQSRVEKLVRPAARCSDEEKLLYIHDFICKNVRYDKLKKQYSHEIIGVLLAFVRALQRQSRSSVMHCKSSASLPWRKITPKRV